MGLDPAALENCLRELKWVEKLKQNRQAKHSFSKGR
jgi:hypothetical protein